MFELGESCHLWPCCSDTGNAESAGTFDWLGPRQPRTERSLALAATVARITVPDSKLATARRFSPDTADSSLGALLRLGPFSGNEMLAMLDWLRKRQPWIERSLANRHIGDGTLILHDMTSSYLEGCCCPLTTEAELRDIADAAARQRPGQANRDWTARALGPRGDKRKVLKRFDINPSMDTITFRRNDAGVAAEAALDGICVIRTSLPAGSIGPESAVEARKSLSGVERAFHHAESDPGVRPIHVRTEENVRGYVFLCMLAYHVEWHMRRRLVPNLFGDNDREGAKAQRPSPVTKVEVSPGAKLKAATKRTRDGFPVHSFATLLDDLSGVALIRVRLEKKGEGRTHGDDDTDAPSGPCVGTAGGQSDPECSHNDDRLETAFRT